MRFRVPASTSNLGHGFDCLGMALAVANECELSPCADAAAADDSGLDRLCEAVRREAQQVLGCELPRFQMRIEGAVPIARGLGSSATIIIALAAAYQHLVHGHLDQEALVRIGYAIEGHPDNVAAAAMGGFTVAADLESGLRCLRFAAPLDLAVVLVIPPYEVSTAAAREVLPNTLSREQAVIGWQRSALITAALASGSCEALRDCFADAWHEEFRASLNPLLSGVRAAAAQADAIGTFLSGSGSTILTLCDSAHSAAVHSAISAHLAAQGTPAQVLLTTADNTGVVKIG